jgi:glyoxylase-like metal-dependent hydrolase (beta-lactamase superfamily II)
MIAATPYGEVLQIRMCRYPDFPTGTWVCAYLIDGLLVDTGPAHTATELVRFLDGKAVKMAVNTHFHEDHISANKFLQDAYAIDIYAHPLATSKINTSAALYPYQEEVWGHPVPSEVKPLGDHIDTGSYRFEVIPTPGHDRDHICLFEKKNAWLFTGDLYVSTRPAVCRPNDDMWQIVADLKTVQALNPRILFPAPAHVVKGPAHNLATLITYLEELGKRIEGLYDKGMELEQIRQEVFREEGPISEMTQGQFSSLNLIKSFLKNRAR